VASLKGTQYDTGLDLSKLSDIAEYFRPLREKYIQNGLLDTKMLGVDVNALIYQVPGGMLSNLVSQLKQANATDKYDEVLREVPRVREDFGFPPLVTPTSQIVGTQAVMNVVMGERYKMVPKESKMLVNGEYGRTPAPISDAIIKKILGDDKPITCRPADLIAPELENTRAKIAEYMEQDEDVLSYALLPQVAEAYFKRRKAGFPKIEEPAKATPPVDKKEDKTVDNGQVVAAISAAVAVMAEEENTQFEIKSIRPSISPWTLSARLMR
jgi:oxaloacetate decarboxylase (Na+ extruding) subunit alpha